MPAPIHVVPYDPSWPALFTLERAALARVLAPWLHGPIEHIGSTAVAGLVAKPVIDIMAAIESLGASRPALEALASLGYVHIPYRADMMHWLCKPSDDVRTHHLHLVPYGSALWHERLTFRDRLRADAEVAAEYAALKLALAEKFELDREAYTDAKEPFVRRVLAGRIART